MTKFLAFVATLSLLWACGASAERLNPCRQWKSQGEALHTSIKQSFALSVKALEQRDSLALEQSILALKTKLDTTALPTKTCTKQKNLAPAVKALQAEAKRLHQEVLPALRYLFLKELTDDQVEQVEFAVEHLEGETPKVLHHFASITLPQLEQVRSDSLE